MTEKKHTNIIKHHQAYSSLSALKNCYLIIIIIIINPSFTLRTNDRYQTWNLTQSWKFIHFCPSCPSFPLEIFSNGSSTCILQFSLLFLFFWVGPVVVQPAEKPSCLESEMDGWHDQSSQLEGSGSTIWYSPDSLLVDPVEETGTHNNSSEENCFKNRKFQCPWKGMLDSITYSECK